MSKQQAAPSQGRPQSPEHDFALCKVVFGAVLSQILYARHGFESSFFQILPLEQLASRSFEDIVSSGSPIDSHERELISDQGSTVFLRADLRDYEISTFLGILTTDIFPLLEKQQLVKFRISFLQSETWGGDCLLEHFTLMFEYDPNGQCGIDVWRAGVGDQYIPNSTSTLWNLGDYLGRLLPLKTPPYFTLAFHASETPEDPSVGVWKFSRHDFEDANLQLQQREGYAFARVVCLKFVFFSNTPFLCTDPKWNRTARPQIANCYFSQPNGTSLRS
ncbi:hypothetical protein B0H67DRAFT_325938 [Lasiosphaeris hirsuta]|uniref:HORMA domain-containing protein n=1 Tax=Lasiosphaeris hirsuta TaxID=260670 RepID=A0AA40A2A8_9PEZI|nr:hypothetical protein B0H67DRAFT_325938 [Lasiosphaeris hirsuta]